MENFIAFTIFGTLIGLFTYTMFLGFGPIVGGTCLLVSLPFWWTFLCLILTDF